MTATPLELGAITDEFSPDPAVAMTAMAELGLTAVELRVINGRNVVELTDAELDGLRALAATHGLRVRSIASPVLKCALPGEPIDTRVQQDVFGAPYGFEDQAHLVSRAFAAARRTGASIVRVFSFWRVTDPPRALARVASALADLSARAAREDLVVGLENEHACNVATGRETGDLLALVPHPALGVIWDPANAVVAGERAFPDGYAHVPVRRIVHVHAKDCRVTAPFTPEWGPLGELDVDWAGQVRALLHDGYTGAINLETHWRGADGNRLEASRLCARNLKRIVAAARGQVLN
jgi:sugar phosphate isomerase/epimerase